MATLTKDRPKAYSYIRWSSPVQAKGNTLERQLERAKTYAEENGLDLVDDHRWRDPNTSGFKGKNWHEGALGAFVVAVKDGTIPRGSYLLVEALDRISRADTFDAVARLKEIVDSGITLVTLMDNMQWDAKSLKEPGNQFYLVGMFSTANIESRHKQDRSLQNWKRKRRLAVEQGRALTRTCPLWLTVGDDGMYHAIPERVEVVQSIYKIALEGLGTRRIARKLNEMSV